MNAAAGGGSFVSLPALVWVGVPALAANISSTIALWPAGLASAWAFREDFRPFNEVSLPALTIASLIGGGVGALLLLLTPQSAFDVVIPWLLLVATLTFAFGHRLGPALRRRLRIGPVTLILVQFVLAVYGGYFGGAVGIMMMAAWALLSGSDLHRMNPVHAARLRHQRGRGVVLPRGGPGLVGSHRGHAGRRHRRRFMSAHASCGASIRAGSASSSLC